MSAGLEYEELGPAGPTGGTGAEGGLAARGAGDLRRLSAVPVDLTVEVGRSRMTVGDTLELRPGSIVTLNRMAGEPVDLLVNGTPIARGEVVVIDEQFGLRVTEVLGEPSPVDGSPAGTVEPPDGFVVPEVGVPQE